MNPFRPRVRIADLLKFTALVCVVLALFFRSGRGLAFQADWPMSILQPIAVAMVCALAFMRSRLKASRCESCGKPFFPTWNTEPNGLCPACRIRMKLRPQQRRRLAVQGFIIITCALLMLSCALLWPFSGFIEARLGWPAYPMIAIGLSVVLFVLFFGGMVLQALVRTWRMSSPAYALRVARACAGEVGEQTTLGPVTVHVFGPDDPTSMLMAQMEICQSRFESLVGEPVENDPPASLLRIRDEEFF